jgi:predicted RNase H-like HicB family nuclease
MRREFTVIVERGDDGYYFAQVPELRACQTQAKNLDDLMTRIREAIELCLEDECPDDSTHEFIGVQRVMVET